jgi:hypothetical protein
MTKYVQCLCADFLFLWQKVFQIEVIKKLLHLNHLTLRTSKFCEGSGLSHSERFTVLKKQSIY